MEVGGVSLSFGVYFFFFYFVEREREGKQGE
jgi:hypothetical protein